MFSYIKNKFKSPSEKCEDQIKKCIEIQEKLDELDISPSEIEIQKSMNYNNYLVLVEMFWELSRSDKYTGFCRHITDVNLPENPKDEIITFNWTRRDIEETLKSHKLLKFYTETGNKLNLSARNIIRDKLIEELEQRMKYISEQNREIIKTIINTEHNVYEKFVIQKLFMILENNFPKLSEQKHIGLKKVIDCQRTIQQYIKQFESPNYHFKCI